MKLLRNLSSSVLLAITTIGFHTATNLDPATDRLTHPGDSPVEQLVRVITLRDGPRTHNYVNAAEIIELMGLYGTPRIRAKAKLQQVDSTGASSSETPTRKRKYLEIPAHGSTGFEVVGIDGESKGFVFIRMKGGKLECSYHRPDSFRQISHKSASIDDEVVERIYEISRLDQFISHDEYNRMAGTWLTEVCMTKEQLSNLQYVVYICNQMYKLSQQCQEDGKNLSIIDITTSEDKLSLVFHYLFKSTEYNPALWPLSKWIPRLLAGGTKEESSRFMRNLRDLERKMKESNRYFGGIQIRINTELISRFISKDFSVSFDGEFNRLKDCIQELERVIDDPAERREIQKELEEYFKENAAFDPNFRITDGMRLSGTRKAH